MPKTKEQCQLIKDKRRKEILVAATSIFAFNNYQSVTTDTITKSLKCSHGLFYHYYKNKEDLFNDVVDTAIDVIKNLIDFSEVNNLSAKDALRKIFGHVLELMAGKDDYINSCLYILFNLRLQIDEVPQTEECLQKCQLASNKVRKLIELGQKEGTILEGDPSEYTISLIALIKGLLYNRLMVGSAKFCCPNINTVMNLVEVR